MWIRPGPMHDMGIDEYRGVRRCRGPASILALAAPFETGRSVLIDREIRRQVYSIVLELVIMSVYGCVFVAELSIGTCTCSCWARSSE